MRTLFTKYIGQTNHKPSRIKAYDEEGHSVTMSKDRAEDISGEGKMVAGEDTHRVVVKALCEKMGWQYHGLTAGHLKNGGFVFVWVS
jgi:hypothetical protein